MSSFGVTHPDDPFSEKVNKLKFGKAKKRAENELFFKSKIISTITYSLFGTLDWIEVVIDNDSSRMITTGSLSNTSR